ncbi:beta-lactamase/transpeptidase-like protein [Penicillium sp. CMV-2018d]|nr:beta-lactamase/transpeptidase-like protein [Penicillium sp. CMV-2018d]
MMKVPHLNPLKERCFEALVQRTLDRWHVPGMAVAMVDGDHTWAEVRTPLWPGQLLPGDFALPDKRVGDQITVEDALSHRTGLPSHDHASSRTSVRENVRQLTHLPLTAKLRTRYQYCNLIPLFLAATDTYFNLNGAQAAPKTLAQGYCYSAYSSGDRDPREPRDDNIYHKVDWMPVEEVSGAGAIITNVLDYAKWVRALLRPQTLVEKNIFRSLETVHQLWQPRTLMPTEAPFTGRAYALGWRTGYYLGIQIYEHSGGMNAFGAQLLLVPELQFGVITLANTAQTSNYAAQLLAFHLLDERLGIPREQRFDWNQRNWSLIEQEKQRVADKVNYRPPIVLPPKLPLDEYAGTYTHAGYKDITVYFSEGVLHADRKDMTWPETIRFQHVTGEHFLILSTHNEDFGAFYPEVYDAEFRISIQGKPWTLGIAWERAMGGEKIWFVRI